MEREESENKTKKPNTIQERAAGILDTIDALIGVANGSENGEIPKAGKQAGEIEAESEQVKLTEELVHTMITKAKEELKADVRKMIDGAIANSPQSNNSILDPEDTVDALINNKPQENY